MGHLPSDEMVSLRGLGCDLSLRAGGSRSQDPSASPNQTLATIIPTAPAEPRLFPSCPPHPLLLLKPQFHSVVSTGAARYLSPSVRPSLLSRSPSLRLTTTPVVPCRGPCPFSGLPRPCHGSCVDVTDMPATETQRWHFHFSVCRAPQKNEEKQGKANSPF